MQSSGHAYAHTHAQREREREREREGGGEREGESEGVLMLFQGKFKIRWDREQCPYPVDCEIINLSSSAFFEPRKLI